MISLLEKNTLITFDGKVHFLSTIEQTKKTISKLKANFFQLKTLHRFI